MGKSIGFKACTDEAEEATSSNENAPHTDLKAAITSEVKAQQEFQEHMEDYDRLYSINERYKIGFKVIVSLILLGISFYIGYNVGAYRQISGVGPYKTISQGDIGHITRK